MPEELHPGFHVEEMAFGVPSIEPVLPSAAALIGYAEIAPAEGATRLRSFADFTAHFGAARLLEFGGATRPNFLALAAHGFFANGGIELWVSAVPLSVPPSVEAFAAALDRLRDLDGISLLAAPGISVLGRCAEPGRSMAA